MPIEIACSSCQKRLRVPDNAAGKRVRCPQCKAVISVPGGGGSAVKGGSAVGAQAKYHLKTEDGQTFGPVPKQELDDWLAEGRITAECQILRDGGQQWQWASDLYPQLDGGAAPAPGPSGSASGGFPKVGAAAPAGGGGASDNPFAFAAADASPTARIGSGPRPGGSGKSYGKDPNALRKVQIPAILLIVAGSIGAVVHLLSLMLNLLGAGVNAGGGDEFAMAMQGTFALIGSLVGFGFDGLVIYGGLQMKGLRTWGLALAASIVAMLPCISCGCLLGLPIGIWSIVVLSSADVKSAFR